MKNLTKKLLVAGAIATMAMPFIGLAQGAPPIPDRNLSYGGVLGILGSLADMLFGLMIAVSVFYILWAAWLYLQGEKVEDAKLKLIYAGVGLAVGLLAKIIPNAINAILRGVVQ